MRRARPYLVFAVTLVERLLKAVLMPVPSAFMPTTAARATRPHRRAYSMRLAPLSFLTKRLIAVFITQLLIDDRFRSSAQGCPAPGRSGRGVVTPAFNLSLEFNKLLIR